MTANQSVAVFYPSKHVGGAQFLLKTAIELLRKNYHTVVIDIEDGWLLNNATADAYIVTGAQRVYLNDNVTLIVPATYIRRLNRYFSGKFQVVAWKMHAFNLIPFVPLYGSTAQFRYCNRMLLKYTVLFPKYRFLRRLTKTLVAHNAIYAIDEECNRIAHGYLGLRYSGYLPVCISDDKILRCDPTPSPHDTASPLKKVVWLGRLDGVFKNSILMRVMKDLDATAQVLGETLYLQVIGSGEGEEEIWDAASKLIAVRVEFLGTLSGSNLMDVLNQAEIGFAMGTSALEIASSGTATILLDFSYGEIDERYRYRWLYQSENYILGQSLDFERGTVTSGNLTMLDLLRSSNIQAIAENCHEYVLKYHTCGTLERELLDAVSSTELTYDILERKRCYRQSYLEPIYWKVSKLFTHLPFGRAASK